MLSLKGIVTKFTPYWFHRVVCEAVLTSNDRTPFPTFLRFSMRPGSVREIALRNNFEGLHDMVFEGFIQRRITRRFGVLHAMGRILHGILYIGSFGGFRLLSDYCVIVARKNG